MFWRGDDRKPLPSRVFIADLPKVRIALEAGPRAMTGYRRNAGNVSSHFKQAGDAIVAQIMKMKVVDF